ncbi:MAG: glycoside hydrolase domain-containing protein [Candidatus Aminicenantales bacterium]
MQITSYFSVLKNKTKLAKKVFFMTGIIFFFLFLLSWLRVKSFPSINLEYRSGLYSGLNPEASLFPVLNYGTGCWDSEKYGNHRVLLRVDKISPAVYAFIPWRRRDFHPEAKKLILVDGSTGKEISNFIRLSISREKAEIIFEPQTVPGEYYLYYLPNVMSGRSNYPTVIYPPPDEKPSHQWLEKINWKDEILILSSSSPSSSFALSKWVQKYPHAQAVSIQAIDEFNSFYPMEVIATNDELNHLLSLYPEKKYFLFPEDRKFPIRMDSDLPYRWIKKGAVTHFRGQASPGEFYAFQVGLYAARCSLADLEVNFSDLKRIGDNKAIIPATSGMCFNTGGIDWKGNKFDKICSVPQGKVQALWCGLSIPANIPPGIYQGQLTIAPNLPLTSTTLILELEISGDPAEDHGDNEPWRHSRLRWLNSTIALNDEVVKPFTPVELAGFELRCLGRSLYLDPFGFPTRIRSFFNPEVTGFNSRGKDILAHPIQLFIEDDFGEIITLKNVEREIWAKGPGRISWRTINQGGPFRLELEGGFEFDGFVEYKLKLKAEKNIKVRDIRLEVPWSADVARYMMGLGQPGGLRPKNLSWQWDVKKNQDSAWLGEVSAGLQVSFYDENYQRPLNTNFYHLKPLVMPLSWANQGKGGIRLQERGEEVDLIAYSGPREIKKGEKLNFNFNLLITPFKPLDLKGHWRRRYYHGYEPVERIKQTGANVINVHHATEINPFINYPFLRPQEMKRYIDEAHRQGMKVKIYYTVRELTNHAPELFALRSLGTEIFANGPGGGFSWLQEHLVDHYITGWFVPKLKDAAIINSGTSRWHNYYLEGLNWLTKNIGLDGLYIDDVAFDRTVMKRLRQILEKNRPEPLIDLHSANQFNPRDGFASSANLYLEHFPYLDRLWFGEYFDYDSSPDYWLIEVSGIPFGLMGEMLQDGGNPYRGMIYGMTSRLPWAGDPRAIWKIWDNFGLEKAQMFGYWSPRCPLRTDHNDILVTAYVREKKVLVAIASWAQERQEVKLKIDWGKIGLSPEETIIEAPHIPNFQEKATFSPQDGIAIDPGKGWLLVIREKN